jgi:APA family basic amino acid/polyamine antiporter
MIRPAFLQEGGPVENSTIFLYLVSALCVLTLRPPAWSKRDVAAVCIVLLAFAASMLALTGTFDQLLNYSTVGDWLGMAVVIATLFWYRRKQPADPTAFRTPWYPVLPVAFLAVVLWIVGTTIWQHPGDAGMGALITLAGLPVYFIWRLLPAPKG